MNKSERFQNPAPISFYPENVEDNSLKSDWPQKKIDSKEEDIDIAVKKFFALLNK